MNTLVNKSYIENLNEVISQNYYNSFISKHGKTRFVQYKRFKSKIVNTDKEFIYQIILPQYVVYADGGRAPGRMPPLEPIIDWVRFKFGLRNSSKAVGIAWAIRKKIGKEGVSEKGTLKAPTDFARVKINEIKNEIGSNIKKQFLQYATKTTINIKL
jgi:hypothetical protein